MFIKNAACGKVDSEVNVISQGVFGASKMVLVPCSDVRIQIVNN